MATPATEAVATRGAAGHLGFIIFNFVDEDSDECQICGDELEPLIHAYENEAARGMPGGEGHCSMPRRPLQWMHRGTADEECDVQRDIMILPRVNRRRTTLQWRRPRE